MAYDKHTAVEHLSVAGGQVVLFRGSGLLRVLGRYRWARKDERGVIVPSGKADEARAELESAGWDIVDVPNGEQRQEGPGRIPPPLPECGNCHQPYLRAAAARVRAGDHCVRCGQPLHLIQHDPTSDTAAPATCPECGRTTHARWNFCPCGAQLDEPLPLQPPQPTPSWRQRYATTIAEYAEKFALPEDVR